MQNNVELEKQRVADLAYSCRFDPWKWAGLAWDWGYGALTDYTGPREWQDDILEIIANHLQNPSTRHDVLQIAVASGHGIGKAQPIVAEIETPRGRRVFGDLKVGEFVFGRDGKPTRITDIPYRGVRPCYKVTFDDGSYTICGREHLWNVRGRQERRKKLDTWRTLETHEILELGVKRSNGKVDARQWEIPRQGPAQFKERDVAFDAYTIGVWLGDGCSTSGRIDNPQDFIRIKCSGLPHQANHISFTVPNLHSTLKAKQWLVGSGCKKFVPDCYKYNSIEVRKAVLAGLLDTDADCCAGYSIEFTSTSKQLAEDVLWLSRSLGYKARISDAKPSSYKDSEGTKIDCKPHWRVRITAHENPFTLPEKADRWREPTEERYLKRWIDSIEYVGDKEGMCISVANPDGLYLTEDFIVTHNSAEMGMLANWAMSCYNNARVVITANTMGQLQTKTAPEVSKWFNLSITKDWFDIQAQTIKVSDSHRVDFVPWSKHNTEAFAGLHNKGSIILILFDEASKIDDKVWEVTEGALTDDDTVIIWVCFGNPTQNTGRFRECFRRFRHRWHHRHIDSREVEGVNLEQLDKMVEDYGEDSDIVKVRVRGMFPHTSIKQFIGTDLVDAARGVHLRPEQYNFAPVIIGVDPAWEGDDSLEIYMRQGLYSKHLLTLPKNSNDFDVAQRIALFEDEYDADAVFIDVGHGTGIYSAGQVMKRDWQLVNFGGKSTNPGCLNKRAEMWYNMREWLQSGGAIDPNNDTLYQDLISPEAVTRPDGMIQLESKQSMKERLLPSPDQADALALTFAFPVVKKVKVSQEFAAKKQDFAEVDYNPLEAFEKGR